MPSWWVSDFIDGSPVCLILGDNIFFGHGLPKKLREAAQLKEGALIFAYPVKDPLSATAWSNSTKPEKRLSIEEKPEKPRSQYALFPVFITMMSVWLKLLPTSSLPARGRAGDYRPQLCVPRERYNCRVEPIGQRCGMVGRRDP
jgi:hypothetical protein